MFLSWPFSLSTYNNICKLISVVLMLSFHFQVPILAFQLQIEVDVYTVYNNIMLHTKYLAVLLITLLLISYRALVLNFVSNVYISAWLGNFKFVLFKWLENVFWECKKTKIRHFTHVSPGKTPQVLVIRDKTLPRFLPPLLPCRGKLLILPNPQCSIFLKFVFPISMREGN